MKRGIVIVIILQIALGLLYLKTVPRIYVDYAWETSWAHSLAYTGTMKTEFVEGLGGMHIHFIQPRVILPLVCAAIYRVAGYSIITSRIGSLLFGVLAIVSLYGITQRWFGQKQAIWIAVATIQYPWFFEISRRVRPEIYFTALGIVVLWCAVWALDSNSRKTAFLTGVFAALAGLAHITGFVMDFAIAAAVLIWLRNRRIWSLVLWAVAGFAVVMLAYIIYVFWCVRDPRVNFFGQMFTNLYHVSVLATEVDRWKNFLQWPMGAALGAIMIASWLLAWWRSSQADKVLATIVVLFSVALPFATVNEAGRYLAPVVPFFCALIVRLIWRLMAGHATLFRSWSKFRFAIGMGIVAVYVATCISAIFIMFYRLWGADFDKVLDHIATVVHKEDRVYGDMALWMGHDRYRYGPFPIDYTSVPMQTVEMVRKYNFDYAVRSAWRFGTSHGISSPPAEMPDWRADYTIDTICRDYGTKVSEFRDPYFGPFEIYKLDWGDDSNSKNRK